MIHIIKNYKWVIASSLVCIIFGLLTFFTFINQSFIKLNDFNLQILLIIDLILLVLFFGLIIYEIFKILKERKKGKLGSKISTKFILTFALLVLIPTITLATFSSLFFNVGMKAWFNDRVLKISEQSNVIANAYLKEHQQIFDCCLLP